ncbi:MAG: RluA family pseudouridine synthase [Clostridia bacterium]|nr:RluA family pseudouridine synthase [Clostridia bacterium]
MQKSMKNKKASGQVRVEREQKPVYTAQFKVNRSEELLSFLLRKCATSRNNVKTLLSGGHILVNGSPVSQYNFLLAKDDEVKISKTPVGNKHARTAKSGESGARALPRRNFSPKILYEDEDFLVMDKPAGLLSVESDKERESAFLYAFEYLQSKDKGARPFVLHRIDKETSGVIVFAKNVKIHSMLRLKWNELVQTREYHAVTEGVPAEKEDTIISYLKENKNNLMYTAHTGEGQKAVTHYSLVKANGTYALLRVLIDTGRKNQIRVHLGEAGCPIVGDDKYGHTKNPLGRLGLHASKLEFIHPVSGKLFSFSSPVPSAFFALF